MTHLSSHEPTRFTDDHPGDRLQLPRIDHEHYRAAVWHMGARSARAEGGQELLMGEIVGALPWHLEAELRRPLTVWLPFYCPTLADVLRRMRATVLMVADAEYPDTRYHLVPQFCDAVYFGTPTLVDGVPLFPSTVSESEAWSVSREREVVRQILFDARRAGAVLALAGWGSGDVSLAARTADLQVAGIARLLCMKRFLGFMDVLHAVVIRASAAAPPTPPSPTSR